MSKRKGSEYERITKNKFADCKIYNLNCFYIIQVIEKIKEFDTRIIKRKLSN